VLTSRLELSSCQVILPTVDAADLGPEAALTLNERPLMASTKAPRLLALVGGAALFAPLLLATSPAQATDHYTSTR